MANVTTPSGVGVLLPVVEECVIVSFALPGANRVSVARLEELPAQRFGRKIMVAFHDLRAIGLSDDFSVPNGLDYCCSSISCRFPDPLIR